MDNVRASMAHHPDIPPLPAEFLDSELRRRADVVTLDEWFAGFRESNECRMLGIGSLAGDIVAGMTKVVERNLGIEAGGKGAGLPAARFALLGGHHSTIGAMLIGLGCFDEEWPPFTSHIDIELFRDERTAAHAGRTWWLRRLEEIGRRPLKELDGEEKRRLEGYYVRVKYNDRVLKVPACAGQGKHLHGDETFCTLVRKTDLLATSPHL